MTKECSSFYNLADKIEPFNPPYTEEFCKVMEKSIMESKLNKIKALKSANDIFINI